MHPLSARAGRLVALLALVVLGELVAPLSPAGAPGAAGAADAPPFDVVVTPTSSLTDGQRITILIKSQPGYPIYQAEARLCRSDVVYQPSSGNRPAPDFEPGGPNCPSTPISSSADVGSVDSNVADQAASEVGNVMSFRVGAGVVSWPTEAPTYELTCDSSHPCTLVVELWGGPGPVTWTPWTTDLTYRIDDPIAGCGGPADGVLSTGGSDRISDAWVNWTLAECRRPGRTGAAGRASFAGEGLALSAYTAGTLDLAYTSVGYDEDAALVAPEEGRRRSIAVPIAVNATVLAAAGGIRTPDDQKVPYRDVRLTLDETAALLAGGDQGVTPRLPAIEARNPDLALGFFDPTASIQVGVYADAESTSWLATRHLAQLVPDSFRVPDKPLFGADAGRPRGADANFAVADPSYAGAITLLTGRPALTRAVNTLNPSSSGGVWVLTDLATARALGLTPVAIENAAGAFVEPTPATLTAAVPTLRADAEGLLLPDPAATAPTSAVQPYPMTQIEYVLVPAEPLADAANVCRSSSQALLADWLDYVTTDGQQVLPPGFVPLTPELQAQATAAIAKVGATPATVPCTATPTTPPADPTTPPSATTGGSLTNGSPVGYSGLGSRAGSGSASAAAAAAAIDAAEAELATSSTDIPGFFGSNLANGVAAALALVGLIVLVSVAARLTSGRSSGDPSASGGAGGGPTTRAGTT